MVVQNNGEKAQALRIKVGAVRQAGGRAVGRVAVAVAVEVECRLGMIRDGEGLGKVSCDRSSKVCELPSIVGRAVGIPRERERGLDELPAVAVARSSADVAAVREPAYHQHVSVRTAAGDWQRRWAGT